MDPSLRAQAARTLLALADRVLKSRPQSTTLTITPELIGNFIAKWSAGGAAFGLNERQGARQRFIELCEVLDVRVPTGANDGARDYLFEKGTLALGQQRGFADVFKRGHSERSESGGPARAR